MAAGSIVISLLMQTGSFETDTARATKAAEKRLKELEKTAVAAGKTIGIAFAAAAAATIALGRNLVNGLDALNDAADATGASVENLSALEDVALRTGTTMDNVSGILVKFNNVLKEADGKNGASQALKAIGLDAEELKKIDPAEALRQTAVALSKFADDGDKARIVQELFGKSVKDSAPFLKDLAEKGQLNATVTKEQAEEAEKFNKQLFELQKNFIDLGRALSSDFIKGINEAAKAFKESGLIEGFRTLFTGNDQFKNDKRLVELTEQLLQAENALSRSRGKDAIFGDRSLETAANERRLKLIKEELATVQAYQKVLQGENVPESVKPKIKPPKPTATTTTTKGPDPDADFKAYLKNLELQIQRTQELSAVEKVLDDIRRGALSVTEPQKAQLIALAERIDKEKELNEVIAFRRGLVIAEGDAVTKENEARASQLEQLLSATPSARLEKDRADVKLLTDEYERFVRTSGQYGISEQQYLEAVSARLNLTAEGLKENQSLADELNLSFTSAFEDAVVEGKKLSDVLGGLEKDIIRIVTRKLVTEPLADFLGDSLKGLLGGSSGSKSSGGSAGGLLGSLFGSVFGGGASSAGLGLDSIFGGFFANGGIPPMGKVSVVGENGPEFFVPNTAGRIIPNDQLGNYNQASNAPVYKQSINVNISATPGMSRDTALQQGLAYGTGIQRALNRNGV